MISLEDAIEYMKEKHNNQKRKQGTPYYFHPLGVSHMLKEKGFSEEYQIVGLFHDLIEDTDTTYEDILKLTNKKIADAVKLLTKEPGYIMEEYITGIKQNEISKMVKLADRIHNLSESNLVSLEFQKKYIKETEDWFIDLAKNTIFEDELNNIVIKVKKNIKNKEKEER